MHIGKTDDNKQIAVHHRNKAISGADQGFGNGGVNFCNK